MRRWRPVRSWHSLSPGGCSWTPRGAVGIPCSAPVATAPRQQRHAAQRTRSHLKVPIQEVFLFRAFPPWPSHAHPMVPRSSYHLLPLQSAGEEGWHCYLEAFSSLECSLDLLRKPALLHSVLNNCIFLCTTSVSFSLRIPPF